jgi:hypothetical protein
VSACETPAAGGGAVAPPPAADAASAVSPDKILAYRRTRYEFVAGGDRVVLAIDGHSPALAALLARRGCRCAVYVTACNPFGRQVSADINDRAQARLRARLLDRGAEVFEGESLDPGGSWPPEPSYLALGVDRQEAILLGRAFRQDAIVWSDDSAVPRLVLLR